MFGMIFNYCIVSMQKKIFIILSTTKYLKKLF